MYNVEVNIQTGERVEIPLTAEEIAEREAAAAPTVKDYERAVQLHLDGKAKEHGYDGIVSACSYAAAPNAFQAESIAFLSWRASCWAYCYDLLAQVDSGQAQQPSIETLLGSLPAFGG